MNKTRQTRVHQPELLLWQLQEVCLRPSVHRQGIVEEIISNCPTKLKNYAPKISTISRSLTGVEVTSGGYLPSCEAAT